MIRTEPNQHDLARVVGNAARGVPEVVLERVEAAGL
jgi:hypothetical protein